MCVCDVFVSNCVSGTALCLCTVMCDSVNDMCAPKCKLCLRLYIFNAECVCVCIRRSITDYEGGLSLKRSRAL